MTTTTTDAVAVLLEQAREFSDMLRNYTLAVAVYVSDAPSLTVEQLLIEQHRVDAAYSGLTGALARAIAQHTK